MEDPNVVDANQATPPAALNPDASVEAPVEAAEGANTPSAKAEDCKSQQRAMNFFARNLLRYVGELEAGTDTSRFSDKQKVRLGDAAENMRARLNKLIKD